MEQEIECPTLPMDLSGWLIWSLWFLLTSVGKSVRNLLLFSRRLREKKLIRSQSPQQPSVIHLEELWETAMGDELFAFKDMLAVLKRQGQDYLEAATLQRYYYDNPFLQGKNVLELILDRERDSEFFYNALHEQLTDYGFHELILESVISDYCLHNPRLIMRILRDCEYVIFANFTFFTTTDTAGMNILHKAAALNPRLFRDIMRRLKETAGCHITVEFYLLVPILNMVPNFLVGTEGIAHCIALSTQFLIYVTWYSSHPLFVSKWLTQTDKSMNNVLHTAAKHGCSDCLHDFIETHSSKSFSSVLATYKSTMYRDTLKTLEYRKGFAIGFIVFLSAQSSLEQVFSDEFTLRQFRNILNIAIIYQLLRRQMVPQTLTFIGYVFRLLTHIRYIPIHGWSAILLFSFDIGIVLVVTFIVRILSARVLMNLLNSRNINRRCFLTEAAPTDMEMWLSSTNEFVKQEVRRKDNLTQDLYRNFSARKEMQRLENTDLLFRIQKIIKEIVFINEDLDEFIIGSPEQAVVFALAVIKDREHAEYEVQHVRDMANIRQFTFLEPLVDIDSADEFVPALRDKLSQLTDRRPNMIMVFLMAHGDPGGLLGIGGHSRVEIQNLVDVFREERFQQFNDVPKFVFVQACQGEGIPGGPTVVVDALPPGYPGTSRTESSIIMARGGSRSGSMISAESSSDVPRSRTPITSDFNLSGVQNLCLFMATQKEDLAYRDTFIDFLCRRLSTKTGHQIQMESLLFKVKQDMINGFEQRPQKFDPDTDKPTVIIVH